MDKKMKNLIVMWLAGILLTGCSMINPGYLGSKPDVQKLIPDKSTLSDVVDALGQPAISQMQIGQHISYKYYYNTPNASVDTTRMIKGDYTAGCKGCGQIIATFTWDKNHDLKTFLLQGISVSDENINIILAQASKLLAERKFVEAYPLFLKAAEEHSTIAQHTLGLMHINGDGVQKDYAKAAYWFQKAAASNYPPALYDLGAIYRNGEGVPIDINKAIYLYRKSANYGYPQAMIELVKIYQALGDQKQIDFWTKKYEASTKK